MTKLTKSRIIVVVSLAVIAAAGVFAYQAKTRSSEKPAEVTPEQQTSTNLNLTPATDQEKQAADQHKKDLAQSTSPSNQQTGQKKQVSVIITSANATNLNAYVSGVLEDGGTCTVTLSQGTQTITKTSTGFGNVNTTNCTPISYETLSKGTWIAVVSYSSTTAEGQSQTTIEAP